MRTQIILCCYPKYNNRYIHFNITTDNALLKLANGNLVCLTYCVRRRQHMQMRRPLNVNPALELKNQLMKQIKKIKYYILFCYLLF